MNSFTTGGHDVRRANAYALRLEVGIPIGRTVFSTVHFASVSGLDAAVLQAAACKIAADQKDCVIAVYNDERALAPDKYILLFRRSDGVEAIPVKPADIGGDKPLILMSEDRARQFALSEHGVLEEHPIEAATRRPRALRQAAERIASVAEFLGPLVCTGGPLPGDVFLDSRGTVTTMGGLAA